MVSGAAFSAIAAVVASVGVTALVFVPFVMVQYRRHGSLGWSRSLLYFAMLLYSFAIFTYTLLPLPVVTDDFCAGGGAGSQLQPGQFIVDILDNGVGGPGQLIRNPALLQVLFNVGLFVPLGMFVRHVFRRGVLLTAIIGLFVSLLVEVTQLTGVGFLFPCSYRLFDVDDLIVNTTGALIGVFIAPVLRLMPGQVPEDAAMPRPVRAGRRLLGMVSDVLAIFVLGGMLTAAYGMVLLATGSEVPSDLDSALRFVVASLLPALVQLILLVSTGRTIGEAAVRLRPRAETGVLATFLRWLVGIGGYTLLSGATDILLPTSILVLATVISVFRSRGHRGLAYLAAGWDVIDDRDAPAAALSASRSDSIDDSAVIPRTRR